MGVSVFIRLFQATYDDRFETCLRIQHQVSSEYKILHKSNSRIKERIKIEKII